jgi:hypothetical protein
MRFEGKEIRSLHAVFMSCHKSAWLSTVTKRTSDGRTEWFLRLNFVCGGRVRVQHFVFLSPPRSPSSSFIFLIVSVLRLLFLRRLFWSPSSSSSTIHLQYLLLLILPSVLTLLLFPLLFFSLATTLFHPCPSEPQLSSSSLQLLQSSFNSQTSQHRSAS